MGRKTRETWVKRVARWRSSDLTAKEFAAEIGVNYQTLQHWKYRLAREERENAQRDRAVAAPQAPSRGRQPVEFVELPMATATTAGDKIELELPSGAILRIPPTTDPGLASNIIAALGGLS